LIVIVVYDVFSVADTVSKTNGGTFDGNVTMAGTLDVTGVLTGTSLDISGDIDIDGTTNLDVVDIDSTLNVQGETTLQTHLNMGDNDKIKLGASGDLEIYHDGSNSYIDDTGTGGLLIRVDDALYIRSTGNENMIFAQKDGEVRLYHNNSQKLNTTSTGIDVTGAIEADDKITIAYEAGSSDWELESTSGDDFTISRNSSEKLRIDGSNGYLHIGGTSTSTDNSAYFEDSGILVIRRSSDSNATMLSFLNGGSGVGRISTSTTSTSYVTSSDHRLKENVVEMTDATTRLKQLQPKRFNFIADADTTVDGFLAHEVQSVVPEAITGTHNEVEVWKDGEELPDGVSVGDNKLDEDGNTIPVYQGIDQSKLVPLLVKTIQELEARITALENAE
jgi:cytoskeletal protein CcmA (bactofilin family)